MHDSKVSDHIRMTVGSNGGIHVGICQPAIEGGHVCWRPNLLGPGIEGDSSHLEPGYWRLAVLGGGVEFCCFRLFGMHGNLDFQIWLERGGQGEVFTVCLTRAKI